MGKGNIMQKENWKVFWLCAVNQEIEYGTEGKLFKIESLFYLTLSDLWKNIV